MSSDSIRAVFMRGGTSKALMFRREDLPADEAAWPPLLLAAMGSPDPYGRQLNGMGGGLSSLSKACIVSPSARPDADLDYAFRQIQISEARVDGRANCGNMSSAVGPFALDEGMVDGVVDPGRDGEASVRIYNTNTDKIIRASFPTRGGRSRYDGDLAIPGVAGTGAPIRLDFLEPGGATTGRLLPTGEVRDELDVPGLGRIEATMIDAANAAVFVRARDVGLSGYETPQDLDGMADVLAKLEAIRVAASAAMGIQADPEVARRTAVPFVGIVAPTAPGRAVGGREPHLQARVVSNGQPHRALPLTISICLGVAAKVEGSLVHEVLAPGAAEAEEVRLGMPAGILAVGARTARRGGRWEAEYGSVFRTARRLFEGRVYV